MFVIINILAEISFYLNLLALILILTLMQDHPFTEKKNKTIEIQWDDAKISVENPPNI